MDKTANKYWKINPNKYHICEDHRLEIYKVSILDVACINSSENLHHQKIKERVWQHQRETNRCIAQFEKYIPGHNLVPRSSYQSAGRALVLFAPLKLPNP